MVTVPKVDVGADIDKRFRGVADSFAVLFELEDTVINVITVVHGKVAVHRFGTPNLGGHVYDKSIAADNRVSRVEKSR
jgi:hypothetical protein